MSDDILYVRDRLARVGGKPRKHELIVEGQQFLYAFEAGQRVPMPRVHALRFNLAPEGFEVTYDAAGKTIVEAAGPDAGRAALPVLEPDQVIARLDELTLDALLNRANVLDGGERLTKRDGKDTIMAFLKGTRAAPKDDGDDVQLMDEADTDGLKDLLEQQS